MEAQIVFLAAFCQVFFLGLSSKLMRDDKVWSVFVVSWCITLSQYTFIKAVSHGGLSESTFLFVAGLGGSLGISFSHFFYIWYDRRYHNEHL